MLTLTCLFAWAALAQRGPEKVAPDTSDAQAAARSWLALVDADKYGESYDAAASIFKSAVTKENWIGAAKGVRDQTGAMKARKLQSAEYAENLPGAPAGKYVVIQYDSEFAAGPAVETVTPTLDTDGRWRVSGYFVKPKP